jgi:hypothetical protein
MNRFLLLVLIAGLVFWGMDFLADDKPDADIESSPRAVQYREKINKLAASGGGNISEACSVSLKHTVLVTCQVHSVSIIAIQNSLSTNGWQKIADSETNSDKYKRMNDVLTIQQRGSFYVISLRAEK